MTLDRRLADRQWQEIDARVLRIIREETYRLTWGDVVAVTGRTATVRVEGAAIASPGWRWYGWQPQPDQRVLLFLGPPRGRRIILALDADTTAMLLTSVEAKGDLLVGTGPATVDNLVVGTDGQVLTADSTQATGVKWASAGAGSHPDLATHDALGLATQAELDAHAHSHGSLSGVTADQHHSQAHAIGGADHTGQIAHSALSGIGATDHHAAPVAGPDADVTVDAAGAAGTAGSFARSAHGHQVVTTAGPGADVAVGAAGAAGATGAVARAGHGHRVDPDTGGGANITVDAAGTTGSATSLARGGHGHRLDTYASAPASLGTAAAGTSGSAPSRGDHVHAHGTIASGDLHTEYQREAEKGAASGYAGLDAGTKVPTAQLGSGTADGTTFLRGDQTWAVPAGGGGGGINKGTATLDFGAFPGASDASVAVTGQAGIVAGSVLMVQLRPEATADHSADEHIVETLEVYAGSIVPGTGFTVYGRNTSQLNEPLVPGGAGRAATTVEGAQASDGGARIGGMGTRLHGAWSIAWMWA